MEKLTKNVFVLYVVFQVIIFSLVWQDYLSFGNGLGDLGMIMGVGLFTIFLFVIISFLSRGKSSKIRLVLQSLIIGLMVAVVIYLLLSLSIWRGGERPWNGEFWL